MTTYVDLELDLSPLTEPDYSPSMSLAERFAEFHRQNPHVADALESLAAYDAVIAEYRPRIWP
jgi:hypothetical protein